MMITIILGFRKWGEKSCICVKRVSPRSSAFIIQNAIFILTPEFQNREIRKF